MLLVWQTDIWNLFSRKPHNCHILETKFLHNCTCFAVWFGLTQWKRVCRKQRLENLEKFWLALCFKALKTSSNFTVTVSVHKWMQIHVQCMYDYTDSSILMSLLAVISSELCGCDTFELLCFWGTFFSWKWQNRDNSAKQQCGWPFLWN